MILTFILSLCIILIKNKEAEVEKISSSSLVVKGNDLIISRYNLSLAEQRLILQVVSMIDKDDEDFKDYYVSISDYLDLVESNSNNYYQVKKFTEELLKKPLHIPLQGGNFLACNWFSSIVYLSEKGVIVCRFDPHLKPYLLQLKNRFTAYRLENVLKLKSKYSIRLYEVLKRYENIRETKIPIDKFREYLSIPKTYKYNDIRKQILQPSREEFKKYTDIIFDYYEIKEGRKVAGLRFVIYQNEKNIIDPNHVVKPSQRNSLNQYSFDDNKYLHKEPINALNDDLEVLINVLPEEERTKSIETYLAKCLKDYDARYLLHQIEYVSQQKPKNFFAYLKKAIQEDYAKAELVEEQEKAEQERIERLIQQELEKLEAEKLSLIDIAVDREKDRIYEEYVSLLENNEKQELFNEYRAKTKELYQDVKEGSFLFEETMKRLITEYIISKNEIYQKRLEKIRKDAEEKAERAYQREKETLREKIENGYIRLPLTI